MFLIETIKTANKIAKILDFEQYRDEKFYDKEK